MHGNWRKKKRHGKLKTKRESIGKKKKKKKKKLLNIDINPDKHRQVGKHVLGYWHVLYLYQQ